MIVAEPEGLAYVHPFADPLVIAGQGTVALEILNDAPQLDTLVAAIGGGGLISGIAIAAQSDKSAHLNSGRRTGWRGGALLEC